MADGRGRSVREMLGENAGFLLGDPGPPGQVGAGAQPGGAAGQIGARPLGSQTGAPPRTRLRTVQVIPASAVGRIIQHIAQPATEIVQDDMQSRIAILTAPLVSFSIYISDFEGVTPRDGMALTPGLPYEVILVGRQPLYAVTDAPVYLPLRVQTSAILIGDRERIV